MAECHKAVAPSVGPKGIHLALPTPNLRPPLVRIVRFVSEAQHHIPSMLRPLPQLVIGLLLKKIQLMKYVDIN